MWQWSECCYIVYSQNIKCNNVLSSYWKKFFFTKFESNFNISLLIIFNNREYIYAIYIFSCYRIVTINLMMKKNGSVRGKRRSPLRSRGRRRKGRKRKTREKSSVHRNQSCQWKWQILVSDECVGKCIPEMVDNNVLLSLLMKVFNKKNSFHYKLDHLRFVYMGAID